VKKPPCNDLALTIVVLAAFLALIWVIFNVLG
jgi:hypothetical protein